MTEPTEDDIYSQEFDAIWQAIKEWDVGRPNEKDDNGNQLYGGATGTDVMTILNALRDLKPKTQLLETKKDIKWERIILPLVSIELLFTWRIWRNTRSMVR